MSSIAEEIPGDIDLEVPKDYRLAWIPVKHLGHHPDNVREDYHITREFCASLQSEQQVPVTVIPIPADHQRGEGEEDHLWWVVKGNRRLEGSLTIKREKLLCLIDLTKADDRASLLVDQVVENDDDLRRGLTPFEQSRALFLAHQLGATRTEIRKKTGRSREEIATAIAAGKLSEPTRQRAQAMEYAWTLDELALLEEFDGDEQALAEIDALISQWGHSSRHAIERVRRDRQEAAAHAQALAELEAAGIPVTEDEPPGAVRLSRLAASVEGFDPAQHADCPGRGAFFYSWRQEQPELYCSSPERHGYTPPPVITLPPSARAKDDGPPRKVVLQGNRAWTAAATVRQEWLASFFTRKSAPKPVARFITRVLNDMPAPVRDKLGSASMCTLYGKLGGPADLEAALATATPGRLALLQLLPIAVAWEYQMSAASSECKNTWREGRYSPCSRADAATWLRFLVTELGPELGDKAYDPAPIEKSLIDGVPYRGDTPAWQDEGVSDSREEPEPEEELESAVALAGDEIGEPEQEAPADTPEGHDGAEGATIAEVLAEPQWEASPQESSEPSEPDVEVLHDTDGTAEEAASGPMAA
ncbi:ParB/RepB/Spo0J family partition protein [Nonomuraea sp. 10N515B]|uniref:ParB/RepB/Spo0J family partition protein n=1 Tax=Nonomuraea sp. 10N515B TaxID=3457422 RepID=UPI003FCC2A63